MKITFTTIFLAAIIMYADLANATNYYFSIATGDDSRTAAQALNPATPWKTINKLNSFFSSLQPGDSVLFNRGEKFYGSITISKSGTSGSPILIGAYGLGAEPVITGFATISGWTNEGSGIYSKVIALESTANIVIVDGVNTGRGRFPNTGFLTYESHVGNTTISDNTLTGTPNWTNAEAVIRKNNWMLDRNIITNHSGTTLSYTKGSSWTPTDGYGYFIQNSVNTLDTVGEWYYDGTKLFMYFGGVNPTSKTVKIATLDRLAIISYKNYITFDNLQFDGANTYAIQNTSGINIIVQNCGFTFSGVHTFYIDNASVNASITINNNTINHSNTCAIRLKGTGTVATIKNNSISNTNMIPGSGSSQDEAGDAISLNGPNNIVEYNTINNTGHNGVGLSLGSGQVIRYNYITNFGMTRYDAGGVYSWNAVDNVSSRIINHNIILNSNQVIEGIIGDPALFGVYIDENGSNTDITNNTTSNCYTGGIFILNAGNIDITNNTSFNNGSQLRFIHAFVSIGTAITGMAVNNNIFISKLRTQPVFYFRDDSNPFSGFGTANNNYYGRPIDDNLTIKTKISETETNRTLPGWKTLSLQDAASQKSPKLITDVNELRFEYNATASTIVVPLLGNYLDVRGVTYNGSITLKPYTSAVLIKNGVSNDQPPNANAGPDQTIIMPSDSINLIGSSSETGKTISSYLWTKISGPNTYKIANANSPNTSVTWLIEGVYQFEIKITDMNGLVGKDTVQITVNAAANQAPTASAGNDFALTFPNNTTTLSGSGSDPDGSIASYAWSRRSGPTTFTLGSPNAATTTLSKLVQGIYIFRLTVTDNNGASATDDVTVTVNAAANLAPTANAGNDFALTLPNNTTTLSGSGSDPDGSIASYAWSRRSGPTTFTLGSPNAATTTLSNLVQGTYTFMLTVTDYDGATDTDDVTVIVKAAPVANQPPVANAGNNIVLTLPTNTTTLTGSGTDADGTITTYAWSRVSGPANFTLGTPNAATTTLSNLVKGTYTFRLTVTDNRGATSSDDKTVTVSAAPAPNQPPVANAGNNIVLTLPTNSTTLAGTGTDADGTIAGYAWTMVSGPTIFTIGNANAATTTLTGLVQGTYTFRLTVTDNDGATDTDNKTVTVNAAPVINQVPVANAGNNTELTLPANFTNLTGTGTDADGTIASYMWTRVSGPTTFTLGNANAATTTLTNLVQGTYVFRLTVTDNGGATGTDDKTVTVNAAPIPNQAPVANAGNNIVLTLPTNSTNLVGTGTDADGTIASYVWTRVSGPATFTLGNANAATTTLTNLVQGTSVFRLTVTDNKGATATDDKTVTVNAVPNQAPIANAGVSQAITLSSNEATLNGSLSRDPDGTIKSYKWEQISGPSNATIASISLVKTKVTGFIEGDYIFQLTVTDNLNATAKDTITIAVVNNFRTFTGDMMLYPNPASNQITLNLYNEKYSKAKIIIYDMSGSKVLPPINLNNASPLFTKTINISHLMPGVYQVEVIFDYKERITSKFIKI